MSKGGSKKYIGVDLGAWYNKDNKTSIAIGVEVGIGNGEKILKIIKIAKEYTKTGDERDYTAKNKETVDLLNRQKPKKKILNASNWNLLLESDKKDDYLINYILQEANSNALIAIDAPFSIPAKLKGIEEKHYIPKFKDDKDDEFDKYKQRKQLQNPYLFDNSARFVYEKTKLQVLAPCATLIGSLAARMAHILDEHELNICKTPKLNKKKSLSTVEVYPAATLAVLSSKTISGYKDDKWNEDTKKEMLKVIEKFVKIPEEVNKQILTDDDYDAIICALTAYLVDKEKGYERPENDLEKFTNSFIYIPKIK